MALFQFRKLTDEQVVQRIRKQVGQNRRVARVLAVCHGICLPAVGYLIYRSMQSFTPALDPDGKFHHEYGMGLGLGFAMGGMLFISLWHFMANLSLALGFGWVRVQTLLIKYYDQVNGQKK